MAKQNVYEIVTERILKIMKKGVVPWRKPWHGVNNIPQNLIRKTPYRGINIWILLCQNYESPYWLTFNQAKKLGGSVKPGEKGSPVVFWNMFDYKQTKKNENGQDEEFTTKKPFLQYWTVFNVEQCEGLEKAIPKSEKSKIFNPIQAADEILTKIPETPKISHSGGDRAYYNFDTDSIHLPIPTAFKCPEEYHSTKFHEVIHWTGHSKRLERRDHKQVNFFGDHEYSKEELVAEFGASFLNAMVGISPKTEENSVAYLSHWSKILKDDPKLLIQAASQAQKAVDYVMGKEEKLG